MVVVSTRTRDADGVVADIEAIGRRGPGRVQAAQVRRARPPIRCLGPSRASWPSRRCASSSALPRRTPSRSSSRADGRRAWRSRPRRSTAASGCSPSTGPTCSNATRVDDLEELDARLVEAEGDPELRCVVLTGAGSAFCAGHDIREMDGLDAAALAELDRRRHGPTWHWATAELPTIVAINGVCYGFGAILAAGGDLRVGGPATRIKVTAVAYGGANLTWSLPDAHRRVARRDLILTAGPSMAPRPTGSACSTATRNDGDVLQVALDAGHPGGGPSGAGDHAGPSDSSTSSRERHAKPGSSASSRAAAVAPRRRGRRHLRRLPAARRRTGAAPSDPETGGQHSAACRRQPSVIWPASTSGPRTR